MVKQCSAYRLFKRAKLKNICKIVRCILKYESRSSLMGSRSFLIFSIDYDFIEFYDIGMVKFSQYECLFFKYFFKSFLRICIAGRGKFNCIINSISPCQFYSKIENNCTFRMIPHQECQEFRIFRTFLQTFLNFKVYILHFKKLKDYYKFQNLFLNNNL